MIKRRNFIKKGAGTVGASYLFLNSCKPRIETAQSSIKSTTIFNGDIKIPGTKVRRSIYSMPISNTSITENDIDLLLYKAGIEVMRNIPYDNTASEGIGFTGWIGQAYIHKDCCPHGNWFFLPWHRAYLSYFESIVETWAHKYIAAKLVSLGESVPGLTDEEANAIVSELSAIDPSLIDTNVFAHFDADAFNTLMQHSFALPYWDWDELIPEVFYNDPVLNYAEWGPDEFKRGRGQTEAIKNENCSREMVSDILGSIRDFDTFMSERPQGIDAATDADMSQWQRARGNHGIVEGRPHNSVHVEVGGMMASMLSPCDPLFWLHHCNVDRIWADWQVGLGRSYQDQQYLRDNGYSTWLDFSMWGFRNIDGNSENVPVHQTLNIAEFEGGTTHDLMNFTYDTTQALLQPTALESVAVARAAIPMAMARTHNISIDPSSTPAHMYSSAQSKNIVRYGITSAQANSLSMNIPAGAKLGIKVDKVPVPSHESGIRRVKLYLILQTTGDASLYHLTNHAFFGQFKDPKPVSLQGVTALSIQFDGLEMNHGMHDMDMSHVSLNDENNFIAERTLNIVGFAVAVFRSKTADRYDIDNPATDSYSQVSNWSEMSIQLEVK